MHGLKRERYKLGGNRLTTESKIKSYYSFSFSTCYTYNESHFRSNPLIYLMAAPYLRNIRDNNGEDLGPIK